MFSSEGGLEQLSRQIMLVGEGLGGGGGGGYNTSNGTKERAVGSGYIALSLEFSLP